MKDKATILVIILITASVDANPKCQHFNDIIDCPGIFTSLSSNNGEFVIHAMSTADPFKMCTNSETFFNFRCANKLYQKLFTFMDPKSPNESCSAKYINKNRMSLITTLYSNSVNLWNSANCDECYANNHSDDDQVFSNSTKEFMHSLEVYNECVRNVTTNDHINNTVVCKDCIGDYQSVNSIYEKIEKETNYKICFDLEDMMNKTRRDWSGLYKCCREKRDSLTAFYSLATSIFVIAIGFYGIIYWVGSQTPQSVLLDERQFLRNNEVPSRRQTVPGSSSGASSSNIPTQPKKQLLINEEDSDDEILGAPLIKPPNSDLITLDKE